MIVSTHFAPGDQDILALILSDAGVSQQEWSFDLGSTVDRAWGVANAITGFPTDGFMITGETKNANSVLHAYTLLTDATGAPLMAHTLEPMPTVPSTARAIVPSYSNDPIYLNGFALGGWFRNSNNYLIPH